MAIAVGNSISVTANGLASWVELSSGANRLIVKSTSWAGSNAGIRYSDDGLDASEVTVKDAIGGAEVVATANEIYDFNGPGYVTIDVSSYGGTAVTLTVQRITPVLGAR